MQVCAGVRRCVWVCSGVCGYAQACMGMRKYTWHAQVCVGVCGCRQVCTGVCGSVQECVGVYECVLDEFSEYLLETRVNTSAELICILYELFFYLQFLTKQCETIFHLYYL